MLVLSLLLPKNVAPKKQDISAFLKEAAKPFHFLGVKFFVRFASSLSEGAFWHCTTQKLSPRAGKVARSAERGAAQRWLQVQRADGGVASRLLLFTPTPQSATLTAPRPGSLLGTVPRMHAPDIPQIIAYMLKLTSISCFSIVMPIYIDNLMIIGYLITIRRGLCMKEINSFG